MTLALFNKEWIKLRLWWVLMLLASTAFAIFLFFKLRYVYTVNEPLAIWNAWMTKAWLFFRAYQYAPLAFGLALGFLQFLPEIQSQRIRLALHLPLGETRAIAIHVLAGALLLTLILLPATAIFALAGIYYFPAEFIHNLITVLLPPLLVGYGSYFSVSAILLETNWRHRVFYLLLTLGGLRLYLMETAFDSYQRIVLPLTLWTFALLILPLFSSYRFRKGLR